MREPEWKGLHPGPRDLVSMCGAEGFPKVIGTKARGAETGGMFEAADGRGHIARTELRDSTAAGGLQSSEVG